MTQRIVLLAGDGIGPEIVAETKKILQAVGSFELEEQLLGGAAIDATGTALPEATLKACQNADAILLGAVGGPKWDDPSAKVRPEQGLLGLRKSLGLFANLRPVKVHPALAAASPLKEERIRDVDILVVRELTGGLYFGEPRGRSEFEGGVRAVDTLVYSDAEIRRVVDLGFRLAGERGGKLTSVDKANVLESSRLWRQVANEVAKNYPQVTLEHQLVDAAAMRLVTQPSAFDVIVTENMFGDILTDEASVIPGSLGLLPSASLGEGTRGLYEPIHGSAPDIAGQGVANPLGTIASAALLLRHSLGMETEALAVETAIFDAVQDGARTRDLGGSLSSQEMTAAVLARLN